MPKHLTVVYTINDPKAFEDFGDSDGKAFAATAVSLDHEMQRVHWMEQAASSIDDHYDLHEMIEHIASHPDIGNASDLEE